MVVLRVDSMSSDAFSIGELSARSGRSASAIRWYEQVGLLPPAVRAAGRRVYGEADVRRLAVIDAAQRGGLSLDEIRVLLAGGSLRDLAATRLPHVEATLEQARRERAWLEHASACDCATVEVCPLFA
jgi:MerR family redox-sensitive transcriptional activator SoxR